MEDIHIRLKDGDTKILTDLRGKKTWRDFIFSGLGIEIHTDDGKNKKQKTRGRAGS